MTNYPKVTFICTTGRRYKLWLETINTFVTNCGDFDLIENTLIVDDRSSRKDLFGMQNNLLLHKFPSISVEPNLKHGQYNSLLQAYSNCKTEYAIHCEDDWRFLVKDNFVRKSFDVMNTDERIKQVTFRYWECMYVYDNQFKVEYRMHNYSPLNYKLDWDIIKFNDCTYWGLSFNPSLVHVPTVLECLQGVVQDAPENRGWDKEVSKKFWENGYRRANLCNEYIYHIGNKVSYYTRNV